MSVIHLEKSQVPGRLRGGYSGGKFKVRVVESVTIPADAGLWSGGSRETYRIVRLVDGAAVAGSDDMSAPWNRSRDDRAVTLQPGFAVVCHSMFCGKDMGLTFYVHPADAAALLPAPSAELRDLEKLVLKATRSYKSSYAGKDRYQMACNDLRWDRSKPAIPTRAQWEEARTALIGRGLLNKAGAITVAGRNAIG